ncbi:MAG: [FeFe] hydrogenase H-cluster maturation GTPase HydF [Heliobacteriaceae bacterium]|nr:[FeFe] hydrogenase H-cluster maturation GTPase HydF [Heliobacteriaceae bacterium]MDD4588017.1 [FeFe] hydrogenase H-cluster maturation GTPase HydF [Heliobacteriaceae bacterium]
MNTTPRGSRLHIAIFGRRNAGKSSLINALTNQDLAIVSAVPGTTTDPVFKAMEIPPVGPVVLIDTAGLDDTGALGELRVKKTLRVLRQTDLVLLVLDPAQGVGDYERDLLSRAGELGLPVVPILNKTDLHPQAATGWWQEKLGLTPVPVSALTRQGITALKQAIIRAVPADGPAPALAGDLAGPGEIVVLVAPIDAAAPKGRLILPQVQTARDLLDHHACALLVQETELAQVFRELKVLPKVVITDSQAFARVAAVTPETVPLTSFSILFARYKGDLVTLTAGALTVEHLKPGDRVLVAEACTHHRVGDDLGTVKIPGWLNARVGGSLAFEWANGTTLPEDLDRYRLIVHCGACMINRRDMLSRLAAAREAGVPVVNYGVLIAYLTGILPRALRPFPQAWRLIAGE